MRIGAALDAQLQQLQQGQQQMLQGQQQLQQQLQQMQQGQQQMLQGQQQMLQQVQQMQQGQQQMLQGVQQMLQQLQMLQQGQQGQLQLGPQDRQRIAEVGAVAGRAFNATLPVGAPLAVVPITSGANVGSVPANYPANVQELRGLTNDHVRALLQAYGQPTNGNVGVKRTRLAKYLGLRVETLA